MLKRIFYHVYDIVSFLVILAIQTVLIVGGLVVGAICFLAAYAYFGFMRADAGTLACDLKFGALALVGIVCVVVVVMATRSLED